MSHILVLGGDGYLGWPTAMYFSQRGYEVTVVDNYMRRNNCQNLDIGMLYEVPSLIQRAILWHKLTRKEIASFPDGAWNGEAIIDDDSQGNGPFAVCVSVKIKGNNFPAILITTNPISKRIYVNGLREQLKMPFNILEFKKKMEKNY